MTVDFDRYIVKRHRPGVFAAGPVTLARRCSDTGLSRRLGPTYDDLGAFRSEAEAWAAAVRDATEGRET